MFDHYIVALRVLTVLAEIEAAAIRDLPFEGVKAVVQTQTDKYLPLNSNSATGEDLDFERRKDHVSHYVLRLAFCRSCVVSFPQAASSQLTGVALNFQGRITS